MPKNAQQLIEEFVKTDQDQQVEQVRNIRRASFAIDKLAAQIAVVEDDERFPVERKQDSFNLHKFARALDTIVNQTGKESPNEKQIDKAVNTMAGIDIAGLMSKTFDKETADLIEHPELEGKTYFEAMPELLRAEGLAFNQKQFNDALAFVNDHFELENDLRPLGINSAPALREAPEDDFDAMMQDLMGDEYNPAEAVDEVMREPLPQNQQSQQRQNNAPQQSGPVNTEPQQAPPAANANTAQQQPQQRQPQNTANTTQRQAQPTTNTTQSQPRPAANTAPQQPVNNGLERLVIGESLGNLNGNAQNFRGPGGADKLREFFEGQMAADGKKTDPKLQSIWEQLINCLASICGAAHNDEPANDLYKQIKENGMNFSDPQSAKEMVDFVKDSIDKKLDQYQKGYVGSGLRELNQISNHIDVRVAYSSNNIEKDNETLKDLQTMFSTRTGRLSVNSSEYRKAKADLDRYMTARENLQNNYLTAMKDAMKADGEKRLSELKTEREALEKQCAEAEKALKTSMTAYVKHASNDGKKTIDQMSHGYGAARLASGNGILEFLDRNNQAALQARQSKRGDARNREISFQTLYKENRKANENGKDRKTRAANAALDQVKKDKSKQAVM